MLNKASDIFVLQSDRLKLRELNDQDLSIFMEYRSDSVLLEYQDFILESKEQAIKFFEEQKQVPVGSSTDWKQIAIADTNDQLIGDCAIKCDEHEPRIAEIGITLRKEFHKKGFAFEALELLINYTFNELELHKIKAVIDVRNKASQKLFEKLGFQREAILRKHYWDKKRSDWFDEFHYGLLAEDCHR